MNTMKSFYFLQTIFLNLHTDFGIVNAAMQNRFSLPVPFILVFNPFLSQMIVELIEAPSKEIQRTPHAFFLISVIITGLLYSPVKLLFLTYDLIQISNPSFRIFRKIVQIMVELRGTSVNSCGGIFYIITKFIQLFYYKHSAASHTK